MGVAAYVMIGPRAGRGVGLDGGIMTVSKRVAAFVATAVAVFGFAIGGVASLDSGAVTVQAGTISNHP